MSPFVLGLVLTAAVVHATWNLLSKRARSGAAFVWIFSCLAAVFYAPLALGVIVVQRPQIGGIQIVFICGTILLHLAYFLLLNRGYRVGDLSLVYPLARGAHPLLSTVGAILIRGERPSRWALLGLLLITGGVFFLTGDPRKLRASGAGKAVAYALMTAGVISSYTIWDTYGVNDHAIPPLLLEWCTSVGLATLLAPYAWRNRAAVREVWQSSRREAIGVALLSPLSYILILTALTLSPISYVAPTREVSILIAAIMGTHLLGEGQSRRRLVAAGAMVAGVVTLTLG